MIGGLEQGLSHFAPCRLAASILVVGVVATSCRSGAESPSSGPGTASVQGLPATPSPEFCGDQNAVTRKCSGTIPSDWQTTSGFGQVLWDMWGERPAGALVGTGTLDVGKGRSSNRQGCKQDCAVDPPTEKSRIHFIAVHDANEVNPRNLLSPVVIALIDNEGGAAHQYDHPDALFRAVPGNKYRHLLILEPSADSLNSRWEIVRITRGGGGGGGSFTATIVQKGSWSTCPDYHDQDVMSSADFIPCDYLTLHDRTLTSGLNSIESASERAKARARFVAGAILAYSEFDAPGWITCALGCCQVQAP